MSECPEPSDAVRSAQWFRTTRWTVVLEAREGHSPAAAAALEHLCRTYWYPLYAFARRKGWSPHEAEDLTQGFFERLLEKSFLQSVRREKGKFRSFLLSALSHYMANEWDRANRQKRGGGIPHLPLDTVGAEERFVGEPPEGSAPEESFDRAWAETLLFVVLERLREEFSTDGKAERFDQLKQFLVGEPAVESQAVVAGRLGLNEQAVKSAVHRMRQRFRELFREEISHTVTTRSEIDEELRYLIRLMGR